MSIEVNRATTAVHGTVVPGYEAVREAFAGNFTERGERGAACAAYVGRPKAVLHALEQCLDAR